MSYRPSPHFIGFLAVVATLVFAACASAQTVPYNSALISGENATELTDGTLIPATGPNALATTRIIRSECDALGNAGPNLETKTLTTTVPGAPFSVQFDNLPDNTLQCFRARHFTESDVGSDMSVTVSKAIVPPVAPPKKPKPPKNPKAN
jgi:hypothetical protein